MSADLVSNRKPAPDIYLLLLSMLGISPEQCVAFEDSENGVAAARSAGVVTVAIPSRWTRRQDFSAADLRLSSLGEADQPLTGSDSTSIGGASYMGLEEVRGLLAVHNAARQGAAAQKRSLGLE